MPHRHHLSYSDILIQSLHNSKKIAIQEKECAKFKKKIWDIYSQIDVIVILLILNPIPNVINQKQFIQFKEKYVPFTSLN